MMRRPHTSKYKPPAIVVEEEDDEFAWPPRRKQLVDISLSPPKRMGRPPGSKTRPKDNAPPSKSSIKSGVNAQWLAEVFNMSLPTAKKRLERCKPLVEGVSEGRHLYDLSEAAPYLVRPVADIDDYLSELTPKDLPQHLQISYWDAKMKELKYRQAAAELWETDDVIAALTRVALMVKDQTVLWTATVTQEHTIKPEIRKTILELVDKLHSDLHKAIADLPTIMKTLSQLGKFDAESANET